MSVVQFAVVLAAVLAFANAQCTLSPSNAAFSSPTSTGVISAGSSATINCQPGYVTSDGSGSTSYTYSCSSLSVPTTSNGGSCTLRYDWCPATINNNFGNTSTVSYTYPRYVGASVYLLCKPVGLGRNFRGNGTMIQVTCVSSADGSTGVWGSTEWCSGALGVSANVAVLAFAAVAGLLYKRFF